MTFIKSRVYVFRLLGVYVQEGGLKFILLHHLTQLIFGKYGTFKGPQRGSLYCVSLMCEGPPGVFWEQGNTDGKFGNGNMGRKQKIVRNKGTSNRLGNRGTNTKKLQGITFFYINVGMIEDFLLFSDFFGKFLFPSFLCTIL